MGIQGLLKGLACVSRKQHIRDFGDKTLAIDTSSWLHKSVYSIAERYVESTYNIHNNKNTVLDPQCVKTSVRYIVSRCRELLDHAHVARLYLVLDGERCPLKTVTNKAREERRQENLSAARQHKARGEYHKAQEKYKSCIKIHAAFAKAVALAVQEEFANRNGAVTCIMSPYEADAQLAKMCMDGLADAVVTEDSDILVYSAACGVSFPILFKLDRNSGSCDVIDMEWLLSPKTSSLLDNKSSSNVKKKAGGALESVLRSLCSRESRRPGLGVRLFVQACVLTGCDYAPSQLNGVGLVTAFKLLRGGANRPCEERFHRVLKSLKHKNLLMPPADDTEKHMSSSQIMKEYEELLAKSEAVFYYHPVQLVSNPSVVPLTTTRESSSDDKELYNPCMERFDGDWSFLGNLDKVVEVLGETQERVPITEIVIKRIVQPKNGERRSKRERALQPVVNPYNKKRSRTETQPLDDPSLQSKRTNPFAAFKYGGKENKQPGMEYYLNDKRSVRCAKPADANNIKRTNSRQSKSSRHPPKHKEPSLGSFRKGEQVMEPTQFRPTFRTQRRSDSDIHDFQVDQVDEIQKASFPTEPDKDRSSFRAREPVVVPKPRKKQRLWSSATDHSKDGVGDQIQNTSFPTGRSRGVDVSKQSTIELDRPRDTDDFGVRDSSSYQRLKDDEAITGPKAISEPTCHSLGENVAPAVYHFRDGPLTANGTTTRHRENSKSDISEASREDVAPVIYKLGDEQQIDTQEEKVMTRSKYWSTKKPRRVSRSPEFPVQDEIGSFDCYEPNRFPRHDHNMNESVSDVRHEGITLQEEKYEYRSKKNNRRVTQSPEFFASEFRSSSANDEIASFDGYEAKRVPSSNDLVTEPALGAGEFEDSFHHTSRRSDAPLKTDCIDEISCDWETERKTPYQLGLERSKKLTEESWDCETLELETPKFTTPFAASQAAGLRSKTENTSKCSRLADLFEKQRQQASKPQGAGLNFKRRLQGQGSGYRSSGIQRFFKPVVTVNDSDDDF